MGVFGGVLSGIGQNTGDISRGQLGAKAERQKQANWERMQKLAERDQQFREQQEQFREKLELQTQVVGQPWKGQDGKFYVWTRDPRGKLDVVGLPFGPQSPLEEKIDNYHTLESQFGKSKAMEMMWPGLKETEAEKLQEELDLAAEYKAKGDKVGYLALMSRVGGAGFDRLMAPKTGLGKGGWKAYGIPEDRLKKLGEMWTKQGIKPPDKNTAEAVYDYVSETGMKFQRKPTQQEQLVADTIKQVSPMVDRLTKYIENTGLTDDNSFIFSNHSVLMQNLRFKAYQHGYKPEDVSSVLFKDGAALQVMGARPWMTMGRGKYMYETVKQHLPAPTDTPAQLYDKITWLRDNILADAQQSLEGLIGQGEHDASKEAQDYMDRLEREAEHPNE